MSTRARAIAIGMFGPFLQGVGLLWVLANALLDTGRGLSLRVIFDPAHLVVFVGMLLSVVCLPIVLEVAAAAPEEVELELFEPETGSQPSPALTDEVASPWEGVTE